MAQEEHAAPGSHGGGWRSTVLIALVAGLVGGLIGSYLGGGVEVQFIIDSVVQEAPALGEAGTVL